MPDEIRAKRGQFDTIRGAWGSGVWDDGLGTQYTRTESISKTHTRNELVDEFLKLANVRKADLDKAFQAGVEKHQQMVVEVLNNNYADVTEDIRDQLGEMERATDLEHYHEGK